LDIASGRYREKVTSCLEIISREIDTENTSKQMERRKEELKRSAASAEQKLKKFAEYLISKVDKRRDLMKAQINKKLA
jgi:hypothetical protein